MRVEVAPVVHLVLTSPNGQACTAITTVLTESTPRDHNEYDIGISRNPLVQYGQFTARTGN